MWVRNRFHILTLSIVAAFCLSFTPALAGNCAEDDCRPDAVTAEAPKPPVEPAKTQSQPIALGTPARVVKTPKGNYARVKLSRGARHTPRKRVATRMTKMKSPRFLPVVVSPEAATAMAMPAATAQAAAQVNKVSIVAADELNEIDRAADAPSEAPLVPVQVATTVEPPVRATPADETIRGEAAPSPVAEPVTTVVPATPPAPTATSQSSTTFDLGAWFSKLGSWFSNALGR